MRFSKYSFFHKPIVPRTVDSKLQNIFENIFVFSRFSRKYFRLPVNDTRKSGKLFLDDPIFCLQIIILCMYKQSTVDFVFIISFKAFISIYIYVCRHISIYIHICISMYRICILAGRRTLPHTEI